MVSGADRLAAASRSASLRLGGSQWRSTSRSSASKWSARKRFPMLRHRLQTQKRWESSSELSWAIPIGRFSPYCLNTKNQANALHVVSIGSLNEVSVHPREVFEAAILANAASVAFIHNHPSGNPVPSAQDISLTKRLMECGEPLGIQVLDHLILTQDQALSLRDERLGGF